MEITIQKRENTVLIDKEDLEIVEGLKNDATIRQIAQKLNIKTRTMEGRVERLKGKVGIKTLHGLVWLFVKNGLLNEPK